MINEELVAHDHTCNQKCSMMSRAKELFIVMDKPVLLTTIQVGRQGFRIKIDFHWTENDVDCYCELANIDLSCFGYKNWWVKYLNSLVSWKAFLHCGELNGILRVHCCLSRIVLGSKKHWIVFSYANADYVQKARYMDGSAWGKILTLTISLGSNWWFTLFFCHSSLVFLGHPNNASLLVIGKEIKACWSKRVYKPDGVSCAPIW